MVEIRVLFVLFAREGGTGAFPSSVRKYEVPFRLLMDALVGILGYRNNSDEKEAYFHDCGLHRAGNTVDEPAPFREPRHN